MKLLFDFFPILLFFVAFKLYGIFIATAVAIAASIAQVGWFWYRQRRFETMHLVTLGIVVVFGGATLLLQDRAFIMWKPTIVNWLFAVAFLGSQLFGERNLVQRMMGGSVTLPDPVWRRLNLAWIVFFLAMGVANLYVANRFFQADAEWRAAAGIGTDVVIEQFACAGQTPASVQQLCTEAEAREAGWVNFKLFGLLGFTIVFVFAQALYLSRYMTDEREPSRS